MCDWPENGPDAATVAGKGAWLTALAAVAPITDSDGKDARAASLAFTWTGLQKSGLGRDALASFSAPFREGMYQEDRLRRLGDRIRDKWQRPVIDGGPRWSGNTPREGRRSYRRRGSDRERAAAPGDHAADRARAAAALRQGSRPPSTPGPRPSRTALAPAMSGSSISSRSTSSSTRTAWPASISASPTACRSRFRSTPRAARDDTVVLSNGQPATARSLAWRAALGEILLGHTNAHAENSPGPLVPDDRCGRARRI